MWLIKSESKDMSERSLLNIYWTEKKTRKKQKLSTDSELSVEITKPVTHNV